ncbi:BEN domain-containing protein 5 isoform X1 [Ovis aries]|uniref:BEN domain-containing protein 5 isoform X1 n=2 Tax=Caprinae TaxID=9963 RepID=UPI0005FB083D|nr:BEN domain-containing protein 5 isoform X1 [Ovis aries]
MGSSALIQHCTEEKEKWNSLWLSSGHTAGSSLEFSSPVPVVLQKRELKGSDRSPGEGLFTFEDRLAWDFLSTSLFSKTLFAHYHASIFFFNSEDKSDLENSVMQKKIKIPKLSLNLVEEDGEVKDYGEEDLQLRHIKRPEGRKPSEVAHKSIEAVVARLEKQNGLSLGPGTCPEEVFVEASPGVGDMDSLEDAGVPRALYEELLRNYQQQQEEMRHLQQELERTRRQLVQQAKKLKEYGALVAEMKELRDLNRRLQDVLLLRLGSGPAIDLEKVKSECLEPEPELRSTFSEEANTSSYYPAPAPVMDKYILDNGKVHLGSGIWVDEEKWHQLQVTQGDSKYTKNLAVMIWGTDVLKNRSVTGVATKKKKDAVPKPPLSPHKLSIVRECLYDRIAQETVDETEIAQRLSKVNKYICEKIMDINKSCKNEERREAKYNLQ